MTDPIKDGASPNLSPASSSRAEPATNQPQALTSGELSLPLASGKTVHASKDPLLAKGLGATHAKTEKNLQQMRKSAAKKETLQPKPPPDQAYICDDANFKKLRAGLAVLYESTRNFDAAIFLQGPTAQRRSNAQWKNNDFCLSLARDALSTTAKEVAAKNIIPLLNAYKLVLGAIDRYDDEHKENAPSSFLLRSALLAASQQDGAILDSWMVYTKSGKPGDSNIWPFLDNPKNWLPEAQAAMAKLTEVLIVQAKELASQHPNEKVILLKGGFGAGKTRLAQKMLQKGASGVVAPDSAKRVVRNSMPTISHAAAHTQGSQLAFKLFDELIQKQAGTSVYDSSLSRASDVREYLAKCEKSHKKMVIYDVARNDMARILSVLKRDVAGDDPRIPPDIIIRAAIRDKVNRVECMKVVLESKLDKAALRPEYHFISGDIQGTNSEEVLTLSSNNEITRTPLAKERLALEGIEITDADNQLKLVANEKELKGYYDSQLQLPVREILTKLSVDERESLENCFQNREFQLELSQVPLTNASTLYEHLPETAQRSLPKKAFVEAFDSVSDTSCLNFFTSIAQRTSFSYLDLPLGVALTIHYNLLFDPWT